MPTPTPAWCRWTTLHSRFGRLTIHWFETPAGPRVWQIALPGAGAGFLAARSKEAKRALEATCPAIDHLKKQLNRFLEGSDIRFDLELAAFERCTPFQKKVLRAEYEVPRGWVTTYGRIAVHLGTRQAARAVGQALATNPFPLIIPCHRAVAVDGHLSGYQGGIIMKEELLRMEGIDISPKKRVLFAKVFY